MTSTDGGADSMAGSPPEQQVMLELFQKHVQAELDGDLETTMATMTHEPHLTNVPNLMGGGEHSARSSSC